MHIFYSKLLIIIISFLLFLINIYIFYPILNSSNLIFPYAIHKFNIVKQYPTVWNFIKIVYYISSYSSILIIVNSILTFRKKSFVKRAKQEKNINKNIENELNLFVGYNSITQQQIYIPEKGLYQNILITGTIGSRKN